MNMTTSTLTTESVELFEEIRDLMDDDYSKAITFCKLLNDEGIETVDQWIDSYCGVSESNAKFLEEYLTDIYELQDVPAGLIIDFDESWNINYRYDFFVIEFEGERYYFANL